MVPLLADDRLSSWFLELWYWFSNLEIWSVALMLIFFLHSMEYVWIDFVILFSWNHRVFLFSSVVLVRDCVDLPLLLLCFLVVVCWKDWNRLSVEKIMPPSRKILGSLFDRIWLKLVLDNTIIALNSWISFRVAFLRETIGSENSYMKMNCFTFVCLQKILLLCQSWMEVHYVCC